MNPIIITTDLPGCPVRALSIRLTNLRCLLDQCPAMAFAVAVEGHDGPHYGDNIKLSGPGKYKVKYTILPPSENHHAHFGRHTDRATGVRPWFKPFDVEYEFTYVGIGRK